MAEAVGLDVAAAVARYARAEAIPQSEDDARLRPAGLAWPFGIPDHHRDDLGTAMDRSCAAMWGLCVLRLALCGWVNVHTPRHP